MLKKLLGDKYKEGMTLDEINTALAEIDIHEGYVPKSVADKHASDAAKYKKDYQAKLTEDELAKQAAEEERTQMQARIAELERVNNINDYAKKYIANGYSAELATATAEALVDGKMDVVFANQATYLKECEKALKAKLLEDNPVPPGGGKEKALTKEEFSKLSLDEQMKVYTETPDVYAELTK